MLLAETADFDLELYGVAPKLSDYSYRFISSVISTLSSILLLSLTQSEDVLYFAPLEPPRLRCGLQDPCSHGCFGNVLTAPKHKKKRNRIHIDFFFTGGKKNMVHF